MGNGEIELDVVRRELDEVVDATAVGDERVTNRCVRGGVVVEVVPGVAPNGRENERVSGVG